MTAIEILHNNGGIRVNDVDQYINLCNHLHEKGYKWVNGKSLIDDMNTYHLRPDIDVFTLSIDTQRLYLDDAEVLYEDGFDLYDFTYDMCVNPDIKPKELLKNFIDKL